MEKEDERRVLRWMGEFLPFSTPHDVSTFDELIERLQGWARLVRAFKRGYECGVEDTESPLPADNGEG